MPTNEPDTQQLQPADAPTEAAPPTEPTEDEDLEAQLAYENLKRRREARKRKRTIIIVIVVAAALAAVGWFAFSNMGGQDEDSDFDTPTLTSVVYRGDFATTVSASGATEPLNSTVVTPEVDGIIENVQVHEGDHVNAGDVLFTLKNDELDKAVRTANDQINTAQRALDASNRAVDDAYNARQHAWDVANEAQDWSLYDEASLNQAITAAELERDSNQASLNQAITARDEAQATANKRTVTAPVSGNVVAMNAVDGAAVGSASAASSGSSSGPLIQIADLTQMKVTVQVNEVDISNIREGQAAKATFSALPGVELSATVQRIASVSSGSAEGGAGGVVTYAVDLLIPEPDPNLKPGMTATVTITTQNVPDTLIVPATAVWSNGDKSYVTVVEGDTTDEDATPTTRDVEVTVAEQNSSEAAVSGELQEGDQVLMSGGGLGGEDGMDAIAMDELSVESAEG